jgi:hypothetical protein
LIVKAMIKSEGLSKYYSKGQLLSHTHNGVATMSAVPKVVMLMTLERAREEK